MSEILNEERSGLKAGTLVELKHRTPFNNGLSVGLTLRGKGGVSLSLRFERAAHNHFDEVFAYCFTTPSGEELWVEFPDSCDTEERVRLLAMMVEFRSA